MLSCRNRLHCTSKTFGLLLSGFALFILPFQGYGFDFMESDDAQGTINTTIVLGAKYDLEGYKTPAKNEQNENDGKRSFDKGFVSKTIKVTSELELKKNNIGIFARGTAYYDNALMHGTNRWQKNNDRDVAKGLSDETGTFHGWSDKVKDNQGRNAKFQSVYLFGDWSFDSGQQLSLKVGDQTINWGETRFYAGGVRDLNAYDMALASLPGSKGDLDLAQGMVMADFKQNDHITLSGFIQYNWTPSILMGRGSYESEDDIFVPGADFAYYNLADYGLKGQNALLDTAGIENTGDFFKIANVSGSQNARDSGQWGVRFQFTPESIPDTAFALCYAHYHSSIPFTHARVTQRSALEGVNRAHQLSTHYAQQLGQQRAQQLGQFIAPSYMLANGVDAEVIYPEDIKMWGVSFHTKVWGYTTIAGELTYRENAPIWIDHPDDLIINTAQNVELIAAGKTFPVSQAGRVGAPDQWGLNVKRVPIWDASLSAIQPLGALLGTDLMYLVGEAACEQVSGLKDYDLYVAKGSEGWAGEERSLHADDRLDRFSWGYNLMLGANWNSVTLSGLNLESTVCLRHDVKGNSHATGRFEAGVKTFNIRVAANYNDIVGQIKWGAETGRDLRNDTLTGSIGYIF